MYKSNKGYGDTLYKYMLIKSNIPLIKWLV